MKYSVPLQTQTILLCEHVVLQNGLDGTREAGDGTWETGLGTRELGGPFKS